MTVKRFRIEGRVYLAETPDSAYRQHMTRWRDVSKEMAGGFVPLVPVFQEHPERAVDLDEVSDEMSAIEKGKRLHKGLERLFEGLPTQEELYRFMLGGLRLENGKKISDEPGLPPGDYTVVWDVKAAEESVVDLKTKLSKGLNNCTRCLLCFMQRPPAEPRTGFCPRCGLARRDETHEQTEEALKRERMWLDLEKSDEND